MKPWFAEIDAVDDSFFESCSRLGRDFRVPGTGLRPVFKINVPGLEPDWQGELIQFAKNHPHLYFALSFSIPSNLDCFTEAGAVENIWAGLAVDNVADLRLFAAAFLSNGNASVRYLDLELGDRFGTLSLDVPAAHIDRGYSTLNVVTGGMRGARAVCGESGRKFDWIVAGGSDRPVDFRNVNKVIDSGVRFFFTGWGEWSWIPCKNGAPFTPGCSADRGENGCLNSVTVNGKTYEEVEYSEDTAFIHFLAGSAVAGDLAYSEPRREWPKGFEEK